MEWKNYNLEKPFEGRKYLVAIPEEDYGGKLYFRYEICDYADNLYKVDVYDFAQYKKVKHAGFYSLDPEYGHVETTSVDWFVEIEEPLERASKR